MGNLWIAQQRAVFADEMNDPAVHWLIDEMMETEDAANPVPVLESLLNRALMLRSYGENKTLVQMIEGGFYGPYNRHEYPAAQRELSRSPALKNRMDDAIATVMAGSDIILGHTDQGLPSDPGGRYEMAHSHVMINGEVFGDWGGGKGYVASAAWRAVFEKNANMALQQALNVFLTSGASTMVGQAAGGLDVDGVIGPNTVDAIEAFQRANGLHVDGIAGDDTWKVLAPT